MSSDMTEVSRAGGAGSATAEDQQQSSVPLQATRATQINSHCHQFACLFTKQLTQKRKRWTDGKLIIKGTRSSLYEARPALGTANTCLDELDLTSQQCQALQNRTETHIQTEKHIIQVEGPWNDTSISSVRLSSAKPLVSNKMRKLLAHKFRKVQGNYVPPPPQAKRSVGRRPLQPGELQRRYYGQHQQQQQPSNTWNTEPPNNHNQQWKDQRRDLGNSQPQEYAGTVNPRTATQTQQQLVGDYREAQHHQHTMHQSSNLNAGKGGFRATAPGPRNQQPPEQHQLGTELLSHDRPYDRHIQTVQAPRQRTAPPCNAKENRNQAILPHRPFLNNGYDPTSFYGEEDEDLTQGDGGPSEFILGANPPEHCDREAPESTIPKQSSSGALSNLELLQLFGGADKPSPADYLAEKLQDQVSTVPASVHREKESHQAEHQNSPGDFRFILPPASDSSSDEDE